MSLVEIRGRGRPPTLKVEVARSLTMADVAHIGQGIKGIKPTPLKRLRDRHHALARALASGMSESDASAVTGYDISRISILKGDPTFAELLEFYRGNVTEAYLDMHQQLAALGSDAVNELQVRLDEKPESFENDELMDLVKVTADRTGYGVHTKSTNVNINVGLAERMALAMKRARGEV